jgi:Tol biopolymer transport system component
MSLAPGVRVGPFEIAGAIGAGGMGEVYRARDTRLNRDVAIKVLPADVARDPERVARFHREAQLLASLNHPNIAQIHGVEDVAGSKALVLEYVGGPTLADLVSKGPIPVGEAIGIAQQLVEALSAAHEHGVVHRDLKPANIKLTADGTVKVLDFGLAKAIDPVAGAASTARDPAFALSQSPTITSPAATMGGIILGTAAYMSPEQARGKAIDRRSDVWAFGCVLFEMVAGRRPFDGEDVADVLSKVLQRDPDFGALRAAPPPLVTLVRRCLEKDRKRRLADIADARFELDAAAAYDAVPSAPLRARPPGWTAAAALAAAALAGAAGTAFVTRTGPSMPHTPPISFVLDVPPEFTELSTVSLSPDGRHVVLNGGAASALWLRRVDATGARMLAGTEGAFGPAWSPDSRAIAFTAGGSLKRVDISSGAVTTILATGGLNPAWGTSNTILFSRGPELYRVSATGGSPTPVLRADQGPFLIPSFLPDGEQFLLADIRTTTPQRGGVPIYLGSLSSTGKKELLRADSAAHYANGHILFIRDRMLMAQPFDVSSGSLRGEPATVAENVWPGYLGMPWLSASEAGVLAFPVRSSPPSQLAWLDRTGKVLSRIAEPGDYSNPRLSPDGTKVAVCLYDRRAWARDIWVFDLTRGTRTRVTQDPADDMNPVWSPDGLAVAFSSDRRGQRDVFRRPADASGEDVLLAGSPQPESVMDWAPDGASIMLNGPFVTGGAGISFAAASSHSEAPARPPLTLAGTSVQFSPDGQWVVFASNRTGRSEIYAALVSGTGGTIPLSTEGGIQPRWSRDGEEIFFLSLDRNRMMAVPLTVQGNTLRPGAARELFPIDVADAVGSHLYDVSPDGQRFLVNVRVGPRIAPVTVMINWLEALRKPAS